MTRSHISLLPKSEGGLRLFSERERDWSGSATCPPRWDWISERWELDLLLVAPGFLRLSAGVAVGSQASQSQPGSFKHNIKWTGDSAWPGAS